MGVDKIGAIAARAESRTAGPPTPPSPSSRRAPPPPSAGSTPPSRPSARRSAAEDVRPPGGHRHRRGRRPSAPATVADVTLRVTHRVPAVGTASRTRQYHPVAESHHRRRPRRPAAARLHRPDRRRAAPQARARRGPVHRRGREGHPARPARRLRDALDAAVGQVDRRHARRHRRGRRPRSTPSAPNWPSGSPATTCTGAPSPPCSASRCRTPARTARRPPAGSSIMESVNDHTNIGAIFRSAAALGMDAVLLSPGCADPLYRRAVKVSMGAVFSVPYARLTSWPEDLSGCCARRASRLLRSPSPTTRSRSTRWPPADERLALMLGAEGDGLSTPRLAPPTNGSASRWPTASTPSTWARRRPSPSTPRL